MSKYKDWGKYLFLKGDEYDLKAFENDSNFVINEQVEVFATPGHTLDSVSVSVKSSKGGLISESFSLWLKSPNKGAK